jgi:sec-independent protein translocase protein TatC
MNLMPHLQVVRRFSLEFMVVWLSLFGIVYWQNAYFMNFFLKPFVKFLPEQPVLLANQILAPLTIPLEFSLDLSFTLSIPFLLIQIWRFIKPALYHHEHSMLRLFMGMSFALLISGCIFAWYWVLPLIMHLLAQQVPNYLIWLPTWSSLYNFVFWALIFFGLAFQLPLMMCCVYYLGICDYRKLQQLRRLWVVIAFTLGMLVTPPDVLSQIIVAIPLCLLYELGLLLIKLHAKHIY